LVTVPGADEDAPLGRIEGGVSERFRFASDGDVEAGGKTGGVRTPWVVVVAAMVVSADDGATVRDAGEMDALRAAEGSRPLKGVTVTQPRYSEAGGGTRKVCRVRCRAEV
jgi:hypothetical protein